MRSNNAFKQYNNKIYLMKFIIFIINNRINIVL